MDRNKIRPDTLAPLAPFSFSQASLQDYTDCARRFQLRHLRRLAWPAPQSEPIQENEQHIRCGERFHRMAQQALLGVPLDLLSETAAADPDPQLAAWWDNFRRLLPALQSGERQVELLLNAPLGNHRIAAKYDLIQVFPDEKRAVIWDWKTSLHKPRRAWLEGRLQTRIYPYLLARAGAWLAGGEALAPANIEMVYWFAGFPEEPERFPYNQQKFARDEKALGRLVAEIESARADQFPMTEDEKACRLCVYRSLCERGTGAGAFSEQEGDVESAEMIIDFDQIGEIQF